MRHNCIDFLVDESFTLIFRNNKEQGESYSLLDYIEINGKRLRGKYISFVYDVGEYQLNGKPIVEHLSDHRGYNLWWMSKIAEKSHINSSSQLNNCIKLLALEEILVSNKIREIFIHGPVKNNQLVNAIELLCSNLDIVVCNQTSNEYFKFNIKKYLHKYRPEILSVAFWLFRYLKLHWPLREKRKISCRVVSWSKAPACSPCGYWWR